MSESYRQQSNSGYYHVTTRGNGKQLLFESDEDRKVFLAMLRNRLEENKAELLAWCLMDNHVHLITHDEGGCLSVLMHDLLTGYARYYNGRTGHVGHVFQGRFGSFSIDGEQYLLAAVRYVHDNPEAAGICPAAVYPWSSYAEYMGVSDHAYTSTVLVLDLLGGVEGFRAFSSSTSDALRDVRFLPNKQGSEVRRALAVLVPWEVASPSGVKALPKAERNAALAALRCAGWSVRGIERLTGIGRSAVARALHAGAPDVPN